MDRATSASKFMTLRFLVFSLIDSGPVPSAPVRSCRTTGQRSSSSFNIPSSRLCRSMTHDPRESPSLSEQLQYYKVAPAARPPSSVSKKDPPPQHPPPEPPLFPPLAHAA